MEDNLHKDNLNGRRRKWKMIAIKDDGRSPQLKTASIEDNLNGRYPQWKKTLMDYDINGRKS